MHPEQWEKNMAEFMGPALSQKRMKINVGDTQLLVTTASILADRVAGLASYEEIPDDGMLFIYPGDHTAPFQMADMSFDISIWFFDRSGELIEHDYDEESIAMARAPYRYVLETSADATLDGRLGIQELLV